MDKKKKDEEQEMLNRLRTSVSTLNTGRSRATPTPLDDKDDVLMGGSLDSPGVGGRRRVARPRNRMGSEDLAPPSLDDDEDQSPLVAPLAAAVGAAGSSDMTKLKEELAKVKAEKQALEVKAKSLEEQVKKISLELEENKESVSTYEEMIMSLTKKEEVDIQEFYDMAGEWKGKAKVFDQGQKAMEDNKALQKQVAQMKEDLEAQKQKFAAAEAAARKGGPVAAVAAPAPTAAGASEWKPKYEQAIKDLDAAKAKISGLEKEVRAKESEIAELKGRLQVALASSTGGGAAGSADDDPLIEMVEKLMKEMEAMAKENEEYMAKLEDEIFNDKSDDTDSVEEKKPAPVPAAPMQPAPKLAPTVSAPPSSSVPPKPSQAMGSAPQQQMKPGQTQQQPGAKAPSTLPTPSAQPQQKKY